MAAIPEFADFFINKMYYAVKKTPVFKLYDRKQLVHEVRESEDRDNGGNGNHEKQGCHHHRAS